MNPIHSHQHQQHQQQLQQQQQQQHRLSIGTAISANSFNSFHGLANMNMNVSVPVQHSLQNHGPALQNATFHAAAGTAATTPFQIPVVPQHQHRLSIGSAGPPAVGVGIGVGGQPQMLQPQQAISLQQQQHQQQLPSSAGGGLSISPQQQRTVTVPGWNPLQYRQTSNDNANIAPVSAATSPAPGSVAFNAQVQAQAQAQVSNQMMMNNSIISAATAAGATPFQQPSASNPASNANNSGSTTCTNKNTFGSNSNSAKSSTHNNNNSTGGMITTVQQLHQAATAAGSVGGLVHHQQQQQQQQQQQIPLSNPAVIQSLPQVNADGGHGHSHSHSHQLTEQQQQLIQQKKLIDQLELQIAQHQRTMAEMKCSVNINTKANLNTNVHTNPGPMSNNSMLGKDKVVGAGGLQVVAGGQQQQNQQHAIFDTSATIILQQQQKGNGHDNPMNISSMENISAAMRRSSDLSLNAPSGNFTANVNNTNIGVAQRPSSRNNSSNSSDNNGNATSSSPLVPLMAPSVVASGGGGNSVGENTPKNMLLQQMQQQQQQTPWQMTQQENLSRSSFVPIHRGSTGTPTKGEDGTSSSYGEANITTSLNSNTQRSSSTDGSVGGSGGDGSNEDKSSKNYSTLRGSFAGGWQSNNDLPDRRLIIIGIAKLIDKMQPYGNDHRKLPIVAKKLEECLYRMAKTKEEYMNASTLKRRLQVIAMSLTPKKRDSEHEKAKPLQAVSVEAQQRIDLLRNRNKQLESRMNVPNEPHQVTSSMGRSSSSSSARSSGQTSGQQIKAGTNVAAIHSAAVSEMLKQQHLKAYHAAIAELQPNFMQAAQKQAANAPEASSQRKNNDSNTENDNSEGQNSTNLSSKQKDKVIRQQQQRLILLRHASKCTVGPSCKIKFCAQMVKLWNHMKQCRNKDCTTPHCLSSRCVLNHYKTCKDEGRTATCEVCAPVVQWIRGSQDEIKCVKVDDKASNQRLSSAVTVPTINRPSSIEAAMSSLTAEFQTKQLKLEKQYTILKHLEQQQALQQRNHEENNIDPQSVLGQKLSEQKIILERCKKQFINDQRALNESVKNHSKRLKTENGRINICPPTNNLIAMAKISSGQNSQGNPLSNKKTAVDNLSSIQYAGIFDSKITDDDDAQKKEKESLVDDFWGDLSPNELKPSNKRRRSEMSCSDDYDELGKLFKVDSDASFLESLDDTNEVLDVLKTDLPNIGEGDDSGASSISAQLLPIVQMILDHQFGWLFKDPVDPVELGIPDYFDVIKEPMDLGKVKERLESGFYTTIDSAVQDVKLVFNNAIKYNGEGSEVGLMAVQLLEIFESEFNLLKSSPSNHA